MDRMKDKVVLITGTASNPGLGYSTATLMAKEGAKIITTDVDDTGGEACARDICDAGGEARYLHHDVTKEDEWKQVIEETMRAYGKLDVLVNNAGIAVLKTIDDLTLEDFRWQNEVNLVGAFLGMKYSVPAMRESGGGSIINLSSVAGLIGLARCVAYGASKGGVRLMTKSLAMEVAADNIRVNSVHPGVIWTNMQEGAVGSDPERHATVSEGIPMGRMGEADDIAKMCLFLGSDDSAYMTGAEFTVDGGMTAT